MKKVCETLRKRWTDLSPSVYCLVILFGSSSWISVSSVWLELPLMVPMLPEEWTLPSVLAVLVQIAIFAPFAYGIFIKIGPKAFQPAYAIAALIALEAICMLLLAFVWNITVSVNGTERSVPLFVIFFMFSIVDCTSNVLYLPYMAVFKPQYTIAYFVGMGFSALVPTVVALIQDTGRVLCNPDHIQGIHNGTVGNDTHILNSDGVSHWSHIPPHIFVIPPKFSARWYFIVIFVWLCACFVAFCVLNWSKFAQKQRVPGKENPNLTEMELESREKGRKITKVIDPEHPRPFHMPLTRYMHWLVLIFWVSFLLNGAIPPVQSYSAMPYGEQSFHWSIACSKIGSTIGCFLPFFFHLKSAAVIVGLTLLATVFAAYIMALAVMSPDTILLHSVAGSVLCIASWGIFECLLAYLRTIIASILRESSSGNHERRLFWCGVFTQAGSFIGAILMFPLINVYRLFKQKPVC